MRKKSIPIIFLLCLTLGWVSAQSRKLAITNGTLYTMTQGIIEKGTIIISDGLIQAVGKDLQIPPGAEIIDADGLHLLPGLIDGFTNLGASDLENQNKDDDEAGMPVSPHLRIIDGYNPGNRFIPMARRAGTSSILCAPGEGNLFSGQSALMSLLNQSLEESVVKFPAGIHINLGEPPKMRYGAQNRYPSTRMGEAALIRQTLVEADEYLKKSETSTPPPVNFKLQALAPLLRREVPAIIRANRLDDLLTALRIAEEFNLKIILNQAAEAYRIADRLSEKKIPVIVAPLSLYHQRQETLRSDFHGPAILHKAGVKIAFQTGSFQNYNSLISAAETAIKYGLSAEEAMKALTIYPAEIFGIADQMGSLEPGKFADITAFRGKPLESLSRPVIIIIHGRIIENILNQ